MKSATSIEGVKISNINLLNPPKRFPGKDFKFHVEIVVKRIEETRKKTGKQNLDGDRVIWTEPVSFAGDVTDSILTFHVIKTRWSHISYSVGSCQKKVADLIKMQSNDGSCKLEIGDTTGQLSFNIELQSEFALLSDAVSGAEGASSHIPTMERSTQFANIATSVHDTVVNQEDTWSPFLSQFSVFMTAMDQIAEIHPYAKMAWSILSAIPKTIIAEKNRNESVKQLIDKLKETYDFITDVKRLPELRDTQTSALAKLVQQTIECGYFIQEYSRTSIAKKIWKGGSIDEHVKTFLDVFNDLKRIMTDSTTVETNIATLRVAATVTETHELELLKEVPYEPRAGLIPSKRCLQGTRETLVQEIIDWVNHDTPEQILVLSGAAGTGKSAIAHTIAGKFQEQNRLGSLFCFSRSYKEMRNFLFSTISRDIADGDVSWQKGLIKSIQKKAVRSSTDPETQFNELIVKPSNETSTIGPVVIVVDALDESGDPRERRPLLDILFGQLSKLAINYRFIVTTRPEQDIELHCQDPTVLCKRMGDIPEKETSLDIQSYVSSRLGPTAKMLDEMQKDWREILARRAEGLFQWAETACRTMDSLYHRPSLRRAWDACTSGTSASLYELYRNIISNQRECEYVEFMNDFRLIVGAIMTAREPLTMDALENTFKDTVQDVKSILRPFGSLLIGVHDELTPIRPLHTSLLDFFHARNLDAKHENEYYVDTSDESVFALGCLKSMNLTLRFNICNLETSHLRNQELPNFTQRVGEAIPLHLSYACRFWGFHLRNSGERKDCILTQLRILMRDTLLYWFEALGLLGEVEKGRVAMRIMQIWCQSTDTELADQAADARQFGFDFGDIIETSTPHLYISTLPFTSSDSFISKQFSHMYPRVFNIEDGQQFDSAPKAGLAKKSSSFAVSLAFSPQGTNIATGFDNGEFWFWDYESGEILYQWDAQPDEHSVWNGIVFSPNGQLIYCCFINGHIRILNVKTWELIDDSHRDILEDECRGCTVSLDGRYVVFVISGAYGDTGALVLCDRTSRQKLIQLDAAFIPRAVFTPKGDMLAFHTDSRSSDKLKLSQTDDTPNKVCLWDIRQQAVVHSWGTDSSSTLALSDRQIAFSLSNSIQVWDMHTLTLVCKIETTIMYHSIYFASDQHLLSYSDKTYIIWEIPTGKVIVESSPGDQIWTFAASFDSKYVALTTCFDYTIHVGPSDTPIQLEPSDLLDKSSLFGLWMRGRYLIHVYIYQRYRKGILLVSDTMTVNSIVFRVEISSPSEASIAVSPRNDRVYVAYVTTRGLCVWNDMEGEFILDDSTNITILEYSPFGDRLISSNRNAVKIWDAEARALIGGPYTADVPVGDISLINALSFSTTGENFVIAYNRVRAPPWGVEGIETAFIEVQDCQSGYVLKGPFKPGSAESRPGFYDVITISANETKILWRTQSDIEILDTATGESELFRPHVNDEYTPMCQSSPNRKYIAWCRDPNRLDLWDIDNQMLLYQLLSNGDLKAFFFSDDSTQIMMLYSIDDKSYIDICDVSTGKPARQGIQIYSVDRRPLSFKLNGNHLISSDRDIPNIVNLDAHQLMSPFYEHHRNNSCFGAFPVDNLEVRQLTSRDDDILKYALTAWDKALFSIGAEIGNDGCILGPHGELLVWIPERRRTTLWRPCMTHIGANHVTKLNFDRFVHGARWMECKGNP